MAAHYIGNLSAFYIMLRPDYAVTKKEGPKNFLAALKLVSFSQLPAIKKATFPQIDKY